MLNKGKSESSDTADLVTSFQSSLEDVITVVQKLGPHCNGLDELVGMCESGMHSAATARLLMKLVTDKK